MIAKAGKNGKKARSAKKIPLVDPDSPERLQYAALPWRVASDGLEIMLVSSRQTRRWIIPKGWPMTGRVASVAAAIEAMEEAGLLGIISAKPFGFFRYAKRFSRGDELCRVEVFPMRVSRQRKHWPEKAERETQWFPVQEAIASVSDPELADLIAEFARGFSA
jgi:8-oxo-dGTP pyrophosphatase MutT (NUDIX family)